MRSASLAALFAAALISTTTAAAFAQRYTERDLVSDIAGRAVRTDANLVNPWGLVPGGSGVFWVSDNHTGVSTLYQPDGSIVNLVVTIPEGAPTGIVVTNPADSSFAIPSADTTARAVFIFVTENGTVVAWNNTFGPTSVQVASTPDAIYKGVALASTASGPRLYAANFHSGKIDVFNREFLPITLTGNFTDPNLPANYSPFNIANVNGQLYVAYAQLGPGGVDELAGAGFGLVDVYDFDGVFVKRLISPGGALNAPWAMVLTPPTFGTFGGDLLVGNFGDGAIHAYDASTGALVGTVQDSLGNPLSIDGLWGLSFGRAVSGVDVANRLYFAAGLEDETHGLFGYLTPTAPVTPPGPTVCGGDARGLGFWRHECGGPNGGGDREDHGKGRSDNGRGRGHDGAPTDSLESLFACISGSSRTFGASGCFTAGCDLLQHHGHLASNERLAQQFLTLLLNTCSGRVCDTVTVACDEAGTGGPHTVGEIISFVEANLCDGDSLSQVRQLLACANEHEGDRDGNEDDDSDDATIVRGVTHGKLQVSPIGANPMRLTSGLGAAFAVTTTTPAVVRLRIYDAAGRLVAEPLRDATVSGRMEVRWDGMSLRGTPVASGNYFYRGTAGEAVSVGRFVVVR
jgi:uncharacterized protein (TIGR03118 family)